MGSSPSIHDVNAERAERIAIVIQNRIFSNQSPFVEKMENVFWTHFARNEAQVHQLTVTQPTRLASIRRKCVPVKP